MASAVEVFKRLVLGRPVRSDRLGETLLPKRLALPIFASDPLSSVTYATQEILLILSLGGLAVLHLTPWVALAVVVLLAVVVASYWQVVHAYPSGGGSYEVVARNLGRDPSLVVAAALMVDYVMTVSVSVAAGVDNLVSAVPQLYPERVWIGIAVVVLLMAMNLRGTRESGRAFAVPTYLFVAAIGLTTVVGLAQTAAGNPPIAESAGWGIRPEEVDLTGLALVFLLLRAFSSGCTALTGVEAISNGVPAFRRPKDVNAGRTMIIMGALAIFLFSGVTALALISGVHVANSPCDLIGFPADCHSTGQRTVIAQVAGAVFGTNSVLFFVVQAGAALILLLAANTAFNGFPMLGSLLAQRRYLPRQLHTRGDRLAHSNGIVLLGLVAIVLIAAFRGSVNGLIQLYIVGVFTSFTLSQIGMVRHWNRELVDASERRRIQRSRLINAVGAVLTATVLVVVLATKFTHGAYLVVIAIPALFFLMRAIHRHYGEVRRELEPELGGLTLPSRVHAVVLVSTLHKPTLRALAFAKANRPDTLTALTVNVDDTDTHVLRSEWERHDIDVPLKVVESPYREVTRPVVDYIKRIRREGPRDLVSVYIPEYVVGRWWENLLHNQSSLRLSWRLRFEPGVMVVSVPWQLDSSRRRDVDRAQHTPGRIRRGIAPPT
ncbi:APC family permease [Saccharopolyspora sp. K220]|uniref:APC family permease n=1 Tax=Saccharopolyspora soli TaxID=2926618 RepID=UPI001F58C517|nr:APC family permease [Saccharopolyspora soli]MCI2418315.1 APC family permease [Saccharopolyspora soli]